MSDKTNNTAVETNAQEGSGSSGGKGTVENLGGLDGLGVGAADTGVKTPAQEDSGSSGGKGTVENLGGLDGLGVGAADTGVKTPAQEDGGSYSGKGTDGAADDFRGYDEQMRLLREAAGRYKPESDEERKERERKERSKKIYAAVGDGLMALSNLFMTTQGAPNMYKHETMSQQKALQSQLDKLKADREANAEKYLQYALKIGDLHNDRAKTVRELEQKQEEARIKREKETREKEEHEWERALQPSKVTKAEKDAETAASKATTAKAEADNADDYYKARVGAEKRRNTKTSKTSTKAPEYVAYDESGKPHSFRTKAAADYFARQHGTYEESVSTSTNNYGETTITKRSGGYPGKPKSQSGTSGGGKKKGFARDLKL